MKRIALDSRACVLAAAALAGTVLSGCGGNMQTATATGRASVVIKWPARSRLIPDASNSIKVEFSDGTTTVASTLIPRPAQGGPAAVSFDPLPVGTLTVLATAYPQTDGTGTAQARASLPLDIQAGQDTSFSITMESTIDHVELSPTSATIPPGGNMQFVGTAKDSSGSVVLLSASKLQWASSDSTVATVDGNGNVTAVSSGSTAITFTETESGKSVSAPITVSSVHKA